MINLHHELDNPTMTVKESYRILKPWGNIFIVDWKKKNMTEGPPTQIRYLPEQVNKHLSPRNGFTNARLLFSFLQA